MADMMKRHEVIWMIVGCALFALGAVAMSRYLYATKMSEPRISPKSRPPIVSTNTESSPVTTEVSVAPSAKTNAPLYFTTMTHMEEDFKDDTDQGLFDRHVTNMRWAMDLFDEYGAKLTFESDQPFAKANSIWGVNVLKEAVDRGHGAGTHAGFGATRA